MRKERKKNKIVINITSLIDVIFLLLIFFLVTSTFSEQPALRIDLPRSAAPGISRREEMVLAVTREGNFFLDQKPVERERLAELLADSARRQEDPTLVLKADRQVAYGLIVELMDISRRVGLEKIVALTAGEGEPAAADPEALLRRREE